MVTLTVLGEKIAGNGENMEFKKWDLILLGDPLVETPEFHTEKSHLVPLNLRGKTG